MTPRQAVDAPPLAWDIEHPSPPYALSIPRSVGMAACEMLDAFSTPIGGDSVNTRRTPVYQRGALPGYQIAKKVSLILWEWMK